MNHENGQFLFHGVRCNKFPSLIYAVLTKSMLLLSGRTHVYPIKRSIKSTILPTRAYLCAEHRDFIKLGIVFTRAAPDFDNLFMGCVFNRNNVHKTIEKLEFQGF